MRAEIAAGGAWMAGVKGGGGPEDIVAVSEGGFKEERMGARMW
jgi:hypothetical protein